MCFVIYGWGKTTKSIVETLRLECPKCGRKLDVVKVTSWATLFFIPIIPYKSKLYLHCKDCDGFYGPFEEDKIIEIKTEINRHYGYESENQREDNKKDNKKEDSSGYGWLIFVLIFLALLALAS